MIDTEKCALVPHRLKTSHQLGYYIYSIRKSIKVFCGQPLQFGKVFEVRTNLVRTL